MWLIVDGRYYEKCQKESPIPTLLGNELTLQELLIEGNFKKLGFDSETTTHKSFLDLEQLVKAIQKRNNQRYPACSLQQSDQKNALDQR